MNFPLIRCSDPEHYHESLCFPFGVLHWGPTEELGGGVLAVLFLNLCVLYKYFLCAMM